MTQPSTDGQKLVLIYSHVPLQVSPSRVSPLMGYMINHSLRRIRNSVFSINPFKTTISTFSKKLFLTKHRMEATSPTSALPSLWGRYDYVFSYLALVKLLKHRLISGPPDLLGFYIIGKPRHEPFPLPYPSLKFEKVPFRYDTEAYLLYLGFKPDQAKMIFEMCKLDARGPSEINAPNLISYANEHVAQYYHEPFWATALEVWFVSEVARLKTNRDPKAMEGYLSRQRDAEEEKTLSTLKIEDYIKEAIWQRSTNLEQFNAIVLANLD